MSKLVVYNDNLTPVALLGKHTLSDKISFKQHSKMHKHKFEYDGK